MNLETLEAEIAEVEREIATLKRQMSSMSNTTKARKSLRSLHAKHEDLVMRVQRATVGAAKPGQVL